MCKQSSFERYATGLGKQYTLFGYLFVFTVSHHWREWFITCNMFHWWQKYQQENHSFGLVAFWNLDASSLWPISSFSHKNRGYLPSKTVEVSNGFTISTSVGGQAGISSLQITNIRSFNVKSELFITTDWAVNLSIERTHSQCSNLNHSSINHDFLEDLRDESAVTAKELIEQFTCTANNHTMFSMLSVKKSLEENNDVNKVIPCSLLICHNNNKQGAEPVFPTSKSFRRRISLFVITTWFVNFEIFGYLSSLDDKFFNGIYKNSNIKDAQKTVKEV